MTDKRTEKRTETHACDLIDREAAIDAIYHHLPSVSRTRARTMLHEVPSAQPDCSDCIKHGGDWDCDHVHCHKGKQPDNDMIHLQKEQAYFQGWEEGRKALREEIWEDGRDRLD